MIIAYYTDQVYLHGGIEKVLAQKLNYLSEIATNSIYLITSEQKGNPFCYPISDKVIHIDLGVNYKRSLSYFSGLNFSKLPKHIFRLRKQLNIIKPEVLVVCNYAFDFYFIPFITNGIKTIKEFHSSRQNYKTIYRNTSFSNKVIYNLNILIERKYDHLVVLNKDEKQFYNSKNLVVIPNAALEINKNDNLERKNIIIAAGRIAEVKQFDHLIKAWSLLAKNYLDWEVHIYGSGDEAMSRQLKQMIVDLGLDSIHLKGVTSNLSSKMQEASIYALTSHMECFPMVLLEALSSGLPVVSYDCPNGPRNILTAKEDGLLVSPNNIDKFAEAIELLINDKVKRDEMSVVGKQNVQRFNEKSVMMKWLNLFGKQKI